MPTVHSDFTVWSVLESLAKLLGFIGLVVAVYAIRSRRLIWFTVRAFNRLPPSRVHERGRRIRFTQLTSLLAALWYLKDLFVPRGLGQWLFGDVAPGIPSDHKPLASQESAARSAEWLLLSGGTRIVVFTGEAGWGKTYTSHDLKARLAPLAQVDVSWTMIAANPESRIVDEFIKSSKTPTAGRSGSLSFDHLQMLSRTNRSKTSPHFFAHIHDFEAIAVESQSLASARRLIERVTASRHISLIVTTRHPQVRLTRLLPILSARPLVRFIEIKGPLPEADVLRLLYPRASLFREVRKLSPLQVTLRREYEECKRRSGSANDPAPADIAENYCLLFAYLSPSQQVCLQLLLARLAVSPERLYLRKPEAPLKQLFEGHSLLRLFAYIEYGGEGDPVARLAHPTVLELYSDSTIMSGLTREYRHGQWVDVLAVQPTEDSFARLQLVRHELRANRGRAQHEEQITSATYGGTLTICRFLLECRSDFHEYFPQTMEYGPASPSALLLRHDGTESSGDYATLAKALVGRSPSATMRPVTIRNLAKMTELLYQGLDAWDAANVLGQHLSQGGDGVVHGFSMQAVFDFDSGNTKRAMRKSRRALPAGVHSSRDWYQSPFTLATLLINEGIFRNNQFKDEARFDLARFDQAERLYRRAGALIEAEMKRERRPEYRLLMLRERLRVVSGLLRWTYLRNGWVDSVDQFRTTARDLVERESGWPMATAIQEFAYFALNASFIELAGRGPTKECREYYELAKNHQEAAGDTWFRLRLDQMGVVLAGARKKEERLETLTTVIGEMREISDWAGIAFCAYQIAVLRGGRVGRGTIEAEYKEHVRNTSARSFDDILKRERLFKILCEGDVAKKKYFPAWTESPMPLNLHGLLMLRAVSLLDQVNWKSAGA
jgi:hypothetical protein